jgi:ribulose-phosphate 3-epimerase
VLQTIHELNLEAGVTLNPGTTLSVLDEVLELVSVIQVMVVNPGAGGQTFIHSQLDKIRRLRRTLDERELDATIAVDGGIYVTAAPLVTEAGATALVSGSSVYNGRGSAAQNAAALRASVA